MKEYGLTSYDIERLRIVAQSVAALGVTYDGCPFDSGCERVEQTIRYLGEEPITYIRHVDTCPISLAASVCFDLNIPVLSHEEQSSE